MHREGKKFILDLVLRDNNTSADYPLGIFHPHKQLWHIKKENIGLIEVMGRAILPGRLKSELEEVKKYWLGEENKIADSHKEWADRIKSEENISQENVDQVSNKLWLKYSNKFYKMPVYLRIMKTVIKAGINLFQL